jgi:hypothetical protein
MTEKQREVSVAVGEWRWGTDARSPVYASKRLHGCSPGPRGYVNLRVSLGTESLARA